jgi:hypothetical protein
MQHILKLLIHQAVAAVKVPACWQLQLPQFQNAHYLKRNVSPLFGIMIAFTLVEVNFFICDCLSFADSVNYQLYVS